MSFCLFDFRRIELAWHFDQIRLIKESTIYILYLWWLSKQMMMFENKVDRTELNVLGEFGLIEQISKTVVLHNPESIKGIGDDAAVIDNQGKYTVVSTDMLVEGVHFDLAFHPLKHLGYKAVVVNLSDIYAMNATPKQILVSIALSNRFISQVFEGMKSQVKLNRFPRLSCFTTRNL